MGDPVKPAASRDITLPTPCSAAVIINPTAGPPRSRLSPAAATRLLERFSFQVELHVTTRPGEATELAARASEHHPVVVAVGGDGTVHEVAKGLLGSTATLAILPCGSGNDFAYALAIDSPIAGATAAGRRQIQRIDAAYLEDNPFFNTAGFYLSGLVSGRAKRFWRGMGQFRYTLASLWSLITYRPQIGTWRFENGQEVREGPWLLVEIGNGPRAGGGFLLTPDANPADGLLDFCLIRPVSPLTLAKIFPAAARGERFEHSAVHRLRDKGATLTVPSRVSIHLDGEPTTLPEGEYCVSLRPWQLGVLAP